MSDNLVEYTDEFTSAKSLQNCATRWCYENPVAELILSPENIEVSSLAIHTLCTIGPWLADSEVTMTIDEATVGSQRLRGVRTI